MRPSPAKWVATVAALGVLVALALYLRFNEGGAQGAFLPDCMLHELTGLHCPGCGNTRVAYALLNGDVWQAIQNNVLTVFALPILGWGAVHLWMGWMYPGKLRPITWWKPLHTYLLVAIVFGFGILRNVPVKPFNWLAPVPVSKPHPIEAPQEPSPGETPPSER